MKQWNLHYNAPATRFIDAIPLGNGKMGAMVYGGWNNERISLNLDSLWSGPGDDKCRDGTPEQWAHVRKLVLEHKHLEVQQYLHENLLGKWVDIFMPAGDLHLTLHAADDAVCTGYERGLCLNTGLCCEHFTLDGVTYRKESFTSLCEPLFVIRVRTEGGERFGMDIALSSQLPCREESAREDELVLDGYGPMHGGLEGIRFVEGQGMRFCLAVRVEARGGTVTREGSVLHVRDASDLVICQSANTNFDDTAPDYLAQDEKWKKQVFEALDCGVGTGFDRLRDEHTALHRSYFERLDLRIGADGQDVYDALDTRERILRYQNDRGDLELPVMLFQFGRYLTIASSMPGSQCANTQGIWNEHLMPPWGSIYTVNINTEMNYWPTESCNLSEFHQPLFDLIERASRDGSRIAKKLYGLDGWVCHHNIDVWGHCPPVGREYRDHGICPCSVWMLGSGWLCRHLWEHYCYTLDRDFLEQRAFPLTEGAVRFYLGYLTPHGEYLVMNPSSSPENCFMWEGEGYGVTYGATMDIFILRELFTNYLRMCEILGKGCLQREVEEVLPKLPPLRTGKHGELLEWFEDFEEQDVHHRHNSHLYGLYPSDVVSREDTALRQACRRVLERRGDEGTGWALVWRANLWARLGDGRHAMDLLNQQLRYTEETTVTLEGGVHANLFCAHPPFQIDSNFGFTAAVAEMLLQTDGGVIRLLPAIPGEWKDGHVKGMRARGGYELDFAWRDGRITAFTVRAMQPGKVCVVCNGEELVHNFTEGGLVWTHEA